MENFGYIKRMNEFLKQEYPKTISEILNSKDYMIKFIVDIHQSNIRALELAVMVAVHNNFKGKSDKYLGGRRQTLVSAKLQYRELYKEIYL